MRQKLMRLGAVTLVALAAGTIGYLVANAPSTAISTQNVTAPAPGTIRILYSLEEKRNDEELIALIDAAKKYIYFAIYTFTLPQVADALIAAKGRGVEVYGVVDSGQAASSYGAPIIEKLLLAKIPVVVEKHASGGGIMHIKALVTESAYAHGSYNWTSSATEVNDEILEIGTDPSLRQAYENIVKGLYETYKGNSAADALSLPESAGIIDYTMAPQHVGEYAEVRGVLVNAHESGSGTVFLDFCKNYKTCPFTAVIFADDTEKFGDLSRYEGKMIVLTGKISLYQGKAEIILSSPEQLDVLQ